MRIALLGPVRAYAGDVPPIDVGGPRARLLLARLALDVGEVVPVTVLLRDLWGDAPPADGVNALRTLADRLRRTLGDMRALEPVGKGYRLRVRTEDVDAHRFAELTARGRRELAAGHLLEASAAFGAALALWQGPALADVPDVPFARAAAEQLDELRSAAGRHQSETELRLSRRRLAGELGGRRPGRLPAQATGFVGREDELKLLEDLLRTSRLVTVTGAGGMGKTRLAVAAAAGHRIHRRGRLWFVSLAGVRTPAGVVDAVLGSLDSWSGPPVPPVDRIVELLSVGEVVLVLDQCEHLAEPVAELIRHLIERLPSLTVLTTSREPLDAAGEAVFRLGPLPPAAAARLFADRTAAARPGFTLEPSTMEPVVGVCRQLDGVPLALELAAARSRSMTVEQLADRFRSAHTLRGVIEWTWDLLAEPERALARRLSMFPGGATTAALAAVCPGQDPGSLVENSLVVAVGETRYRMPEAVRAFAAEQLQRSGERETVSAAFSHYFQILVEEHEPLSRSGSQLASLAFFEAEYDNLMFALRSAIEAGAANQAYRLLGPMVWYWITRRNESRADAFLTEVLEFGDALPEQAGAALTAMRLLAGAEADPEQVLPVLEACVRTDAFERYSMLLAALPMALSLGHEELVEQELRRAQKRSDRWSQAWGHWLEAFVRAGRGDWLGGGTARAEALRGFEEVGDRLGLTKVLAAVADDHSWRGEHDQALAARERVVVLSNEMGSEDEITHRISLAVERVRCGDPAGAWRDTEIAWRVVEERGYRHSAVGVLLCFADLHRRAGELDQAESVLDRVEALARKFSLPTHLVAPVRMALSFARGVEPRPLLPDVVAAAFAVRDLAPAAESLARLLLVEGDAVGAASALGMSAALRGVFDQGDPELRELVGELVKRLGLAAYESGYRRGARMSRDAAVQVLLDLQPEGAH